MALDELRWMGSHKVMAMEVEYERTPLANGFRVPTEDIGSVLERIGCKLFIRERTLSQYVGWAVREGLFRFLSKCDDATPSDVAANTLLTECGADCLLGVLAAVRLVVRSSISGYRLTSAARDYFLEGSPFYIGNQLRPDGHPMPQAYCRRRANILERLKSKVVMLHPLLRYGSSDRIDNQHARNLGACAAAVRTGEFAAVSCMVDVAGGSGAFAIPYALDYPSTRIILTDLPAALAGARAIVEAHHLRERIELMELDAFAYPWKIPECDGIFIGNFLHGFGDETCIRVCRESFQRLQPGGKLWVHEMLWNDAKDGPLITALWHATMRGAGPGRQRTAAELSSILTLAGFGNIRTRRTAGPYALVSGEKPLNRLSAA